MYMEWDVSEYVESLNNFKYLQKSLYSMYSNVPAMYSLIWVQTFLLTFRLTTRRFWTIIGLGG